MKQQVVVLWLIAAVLLPANIEARADTVRVKSSSEFRTAIGRLIPGTKLLLEPGVYSGGVDLRDVKGTREKRIVIRGEDPANQPLFSGGRQAIHLANCSYVTLSNMKAKGFPTNGINIDDGGSFETPAHHIDCNLIIFDSKIQTFVNVGPGTSPETFVMRRNAWHDIDGYLEPSLPVPETESVYLRDISIDRTKLTDGKLELNDDRVKEIGAHAYKRIR